MLCIETTRANGFVKFNFVDFDLGFHRLTLKMYNFLKTWTCNHFKLLEKELLICQKYIFKTLPPLQNKHSSQSFYDLKNLCLKQ